MKKAIFLLFVIMTIIGSLAYDKDDKRVGMAQEVDDLLQQLSGKRVDDVKGWSGVEWGMTENQIKDVLKGKIKRLPDVDTYAGGDYANLWGYTKIDDILYTAYFVMDNNTNGLKFVNIKPARTEDVYRLFNLYLSLDRALTEAYGPGREDHSHSGSTHSKYWQFPSTIISLTYSGGITEYVGSDALTLQYRSRISPKKAKKEALAEGKNLEATRHFDLGISFFKANNFNSAIAQFQEAIKLEPDWAEAHYNLAFCYYKKSLNDLAVEHCRKALQIKPSLVEAQRLLDRLLHNK